MQTPGDLFDAGYAIPAYSIAPSPKHCYRFRDTYFYSLHTPTVRFEGLDFPVAKLEDAQAQKL